MRRLQTGVWPLETDHDFHQRRPRLPSRVTIRHIANLNNVENAIPESFLAKENSVSDGRESSRKLYSLRLQDEESRRFLAVFVNNRNSFLTREIDRLDQKPKSLPKNRDPMYSN